MRVILCSAPACPMCFFLHMLTKNLLLCLNIYFTVLKKCNQNVTCPQAPNLLASLPWSASGSSVSWNSRFSFWTHFTLCNKSDQRSIWSESCNFAEQIQNSLFECISHFLSKHSWETHCTLWIKNSKLYKFRLDTAYNVFTIVLLLSFATTPPINSAYLVAFYSTLTAITSRTLMEQITVC